MPATPILSQITALEDQLADLQQHLARTDHLATVATVAAGVAHEANNRLTPALAYAHHLRGSLETNDPLERKAIERVIDGIEAASRLLTTMLDLATPPGDGEGGNVADAVARAIACLGEPLSHDRITVRTQIPDELTTRAPAPAIQQIVLNLLLNARRAVRSRGGGTIDVTAASAGSDLLITVADDGPGIPLSIRDRLFEPFVSAAQQPRASDTRACEERGYGLGLAVCRRLTDQFGGRISVEHPEQGGACFRVTLPASCSGRKPSEPAAPNAAAGRTDHASSRACSGTT